jgi:hypothetical protein
VIEASQIDQVCAFVNALPLDDRAIFGLLSGAGGLNAIDRENVKDALGISTVAANKKVARAFRRLRLAMNLPAEVEDEDVVEALIVGETRRRAAGAMTTRPDPAAVVHEFGLKFDSLAPSGAVGAKLAEDAEIPWGILPFNEPAKHPDSQIKDVGDGPVIEPTGPAPAFNGLFKDPPPESPPAVDPEVSDAFAKIKAEAKAAPRPSRRAPAPPPVEEGE